LKKSEVDKMYDEQEFVERLKNAEEKAYKELIDTYKNKILKTALSFVPFFEDAEDITQEVFIEVFRSIKKFRQDSSLSTWIYRISVNKSINYTKKNRKYFENKSINDYYAFENIQSQNDSNETLYNMESKQLAQLIHNALQTLNEKQRTVFVMHKIEGIPYKEISNLLGISLSSVESLMHRAKLKLQKKLDILKR